MGNWSYTLLPYVMSLDPPSPCIMLLRLIPEDAWHSHVHYALIRTARTKGDQLYKNWKWPTGFGGYSDEGASLLERIILTSNNIHVAVES